MSRNLELARIELTLMLSHIIVATATELAVVMREMVEDATVVVVAVAVRDMIVHREETVL
jgi:hypothetical protein